MSIKGNDNIDWKDVENKISIICYRFSNLEPWHQDLAQELRIHAYYVSDNYYDLYRKAIDFWRKIQTKQSPETPYFDLDVLSPTVEDNTFDQFDEIVFLIRRELDRPGQDKWEDKMMAVATQLLDLIVEDIDENITPKKRVETERNKYHNQRLSLSWAAEETGIGYKRLVAAMRLLEEVITGLALMGKIDIDKIYIEDFFKDE